MFHGYYAIRNDFQVNGKEIMLTHVNYNKSSTKLQPALIAIFSTNSLFGNFFSQSSTQEATAKFKETNFSCLMFAVSTNFCKISERFRTISEKI